MRATAVTYAAIVSSDRRSARSLALPSSRASRAVLALALLAVIVALRVVLGPSASAGLSFLLIVPVAVVAVDLGPWGGLAAGVGAYAVFFVWVLTGQFVDTGVDAHLIRGTVYLLVGLAAGWSADQLRRSEARQRYIADSLGDLVSVHDPAGRYVYASSAAHELLGYEPAQLCGTSAYDYLHPYDASGVRQGHESLLDDDALHTDVYRARRADGRYVWLETVSRPMRVDGEVQEILCSSRDVTARETERMALEEDHEALRAQIKEVLDGGLIRTVIQPIVELSTGAVAGYEALSRFPAPADRPPGLWFEHAGRVGLAQVLELTAIRRACEVLNQIPESSRLNVNASPQTVCAPGLLEILDGVETHRLVIELTEHEAIDDYAALNAAISILRARGVQIAVDDAGAGYASLRHILDIRPEIIKLDMSLTRHIHRDEARRALTSALCDFAANLNASVVAEGIEEQAELDALVSLGIRYGQGYLLGLPAEP